MSVFSDVHYSILRLLAECGWVSQRLLELTGYSYTYRTRSLKLLLDLQYIRKQGQGENKAYALAAKGRNHLTGFNACRFREEVMAETKQLARHPERAVLRGDAAAILSFAGFAVHMDDKPILPAFTPPLADKPTRANWQSVYQNTQLFSYPDEIDNHFYERRSSSINCYYDATVIKEQAGKSRWDTMGIGYSRACGVLVTPSYLLKVYHSRDVAMKIQTTGERNLQNLLLTDVILSGYRPQQNNAALVFGNGFTAALHIFSHYIDGTAAKSPVYVKRRKQKGYVVLEGATGEMLTPTNLGNPVFYLPLCKDSLLLLRLMHFPLWQEMLICEINQELFHLNQEFRWNFELEGDSIYILVSLNLSQIDLALRRIKADNKGARILCMDWQEPLFRQLLEPFAQSRDIRITRLPTEYMENVQDKFKRYWEG